MKILTKNLKAFVLASSCMVMLATIGGRRAFGQTMTVTDSAKTFDAAKAAVAPGIKLDGFTTQIEGASVYVQGEQTGDSLSLTSGNAKISVTKASETILKLVGTATAAEYQAVLSKVTFTPGSSSETKPRKVVFTAGPGLAFTVGGKDHYYEYISQPDITWTAAKAAAEKMMYLGKLRGYLATITSKDENDFVTTKLKGNGWLGAHDADKEGMWKWVTGPESGQQFWQGSAAAKGGKAVNGMFSQWATGEPNEFQGVGGEDHLHFWGSGTTKGQWNDFPNASPQIDGYVVEFGGMPDDPTIQASAEVTISQQSPVPVKPVNPIRPVSAGEVHMRTTDGLAYDFQGTGEFLCVKSSDGKMILQTRQSPYPIKPNLSINTAAALFVEGQKIEFYLWPQFSWFVNDKEQPLPADRGGMEFSGGTKIEYTIPGKDQKQFTIYRGDKSSAVRITTFGISHMDVGVRYDNEAHTYQGMYGSPDKNPRNDMTLRTGEIVKPPASITDLNRFTDSWRLTTKESLFGDAQRNKHKEALAKSSHTDVQIPKDKWDAAEKQVKAAGITSPIVVRNATYDLALTDAKIFIESAKADDAVVKSLPPAERKLVAGDTANQAAVDAENQAAAANAQPPTVDQIVASGATWEGNWDWAHDDKQAKNHSKLTVKSATEFVYIYAGAVYHLSGKLGHSGGSTKNPPAVNLTLPNGDDLRFEWKSLETADGQFWNKGMKAGVTAHNKPQTTAKLVRAPSK